MKRGWNLAQVATFAAAMLCVRIGLVLLRRAFPSAFSILEGPRIPTEIVLCLVYIAVSMLVLILCRRITRGRPLAETAIIGALVGGFLFTLDLIK